MTCPVDRDDLRMRPAEIHVGALAEDHTIGRDHDRTNDGIRRRAAAAAFSPEQRARHERPVLVAVYHFSVKRASTYASASNGSRSSIASPTPIYRIGNRRSCAIATATPPLAVPSSLV